MSIEAINQQLLRAIGVGAKDWRVIQEIDVKTGLVEEEWNSLDFVPVSASNFASVWYFTAK